MDPGRIRGSRTGVFVGCSASEAHEAWALDLETIVGYEMTGCTRSMFANRLSYFFDFKGKEIGMDNIFCVTGPLWGESTGHRWIPLTKANDAELWCLIWSAPEQTDKQTIETSVIWDVIALIMTSL